VRRSFKLAAIAGATTFILGMIGCASEGWHAPPMFAIAAIYLAGIVAGVLAMRQASGERATGFAPDVELLRSPTTRVEAHIVASLLGAATALGGAVVVATLIDHVEPLFLASVLGSAWMGTYPFHPIVALRLLRGEIAVGLDGIRMGRNLVPFAEVLGARADGTNLEIACRSGQRFVRSMPSAAVTNLLAERINAKAGAPAAPPGPRRLGRQGRSLETWRRELMSSDYRESAVRSEEASLILAAGSSAPDERIGAALVLAEAGARDRVRVAASACLDPRVRVALERVADDSLDEETAARAESPAARGTIRAGRA
jgi:hypothetical protein